jgi:hypothetical protein
MPKRVIDFDAMWGSDKLAACAEWAQGEYAWLYGLADASGCFELTNLRVIWGRVAAIRRNLSLERLEQVFHEFQNKGLLFVWEVNGKRYGHWTGSDVPGRLPPPSWRMRLERLAPPVPKQQLAEFTSRFSRGRAASPGGGFFADCSARETQGPVRVSVDKRLNVDLEAAQAQDWDWNQKEGKEEFAQRPHFEQFNTQQLAGGSDSPEQQTVLPNLTLKSGNPLPETTASASQTPSTQAAHAVAARGAPVYSSRDKSAVVARELVVGRGPQCGPVRVKPEVLDRIRLRDRSRSP